jgi:hypothetical protein
VFHLAGERSGGLKGHTWGRYSSWALSVFGLVALGPLGCTHHPPTAGIKERLFWLAFVGWEWLAVLLVVMAACTFLGWPVAKKAVKRMGWAWTCLLVLSLIPMACGAGIMLGRHMLYHSMLQWGTWEYLQEMFRFMLWSFLVTGTLLLPWRPWKLFQFGSIPRAVALLLALLLINYMLAAAVYINAGLVDME